MKNENKQSIDFKGLFDKYRNQILIGLAALVVIIIIAVVVGKIGKGAKNDPDAVRENAYPEVKTLINNYYDAYANGKTKEVKKYAMPISDNELSYMKLISKYVKSYKVKNIYTMQGVDSDACLVSVEVEMKFKDVKTSAPGLDFFYVSGIETGELYINNLYSQFNAKTKEYATEEQIVTRISEYEAKEEIKDLQTKVQEAYEKAIEKDEKLDVMVNSTFEGAVSEWIGTIALEQNQTPPQSALAGDDKKKEETDKKDQEEPKKDEPKEDKNNDDKKGETVKPKKVKVTEYVKTKEEVNLREGASTNTDAICMLKSGAKLKVLYMNVWGEWTCVKTSSGKKGYVRNDFLKTLANKNAVTGKDGCPEKNKKYKLVKKTNLLNKMKSSGKVISSLAKGSKVKIIAAYANGYSKVYTNGRTGYILTEKLKLD